MVLGTAGFMLEASRVRFCRLSQYQIKDMILKLIDHDAGHAGSCY